MKKFVSGLVLTLAVVVAQAQMVWYDPMQAEGSVMQNQAFAEEIHGYARLPKRAQGEVRDAVWSLAQNSAGEMIAFYTNSPDVEVRYTTTSASYAMPHMPATGVSGVDLYRIDSDGVEAYCAGRYSFGDDGVTYKFTGMPTSPQHHKLGYEYRLYLPLYNGVKQMQIGVKEGSEFRFVPTREERPIVLYGTSIAQGGCVSRPAMAWGTILQRALDLPLVNMGFSGNGRLEREVLSYICQMDARLYILDCLPNILEDPVEDIERLTVETVRQIRQKSEEPILLVDHVGYTTFDTNPKNHDYVIAANKASRRAYEKLLADGVKNLFYITREQMGITLEMAVDGNHLTDLGQMQQARAVESVVRDILHMPKGDKRTQQAVKQRREPGTYEWAERHASILRAVKMSAPKSVILGNSIVHYWGGAHRIENGRKVWNEKMKEYLNMGCGWDRIENVLWRVYHGALDGYKAERVVVMIGTNNLGTDSDEDIVSGIEFLLEAIRQRQPEAEIRVVGLLPRRGQEQRVKDVNVRMRAMAELGGYDYVDVGASLLQQDGKIMEECFTDGLHPNELGYGRIVEQIIQ
ncbi:MAG: SGNH/GDSL hydrolase family protein [Rikenellaceae bacterium]|nr:SGNH/GDSL hydrolase family protein [Rikenellaceae bacterium]